MPVESSPFVFTWIGKAMERREGKFEEDAKVETLDIWDFRNLKFFYFEIL